MAHPEAARLSFELIQALTEEGPDNSIVPDNFSGVLTVLDDFAAMAGLVQEQRQPRDRRAEPLSVAKHVFLHRILKSFIDINFSSPNISRGKAAVDLIPILHKKITPWVQNSEISETLGNTIHLQ